MPRRPAPLPPGLPTRAFTAARAAELGIGPERLRRSDIEKIGRGAYRLVGAVTTELDVAGALIAGNPDLVASHATAARIRRWPLPFGVRHEDWVLDTPLELTATSPRGRIRRHGLTLHRQDLPDADRSLIRGVPVTSRERTFVDLGERLSLLQLVSIGDHLVRYPRPEIEGRVGPFSTIDALASAVNRSTGRPGVRGARAALRRVRVGSDSPKETELRLALEDAGVPEALLNVPIIGPQGESLHEPDLQWPRWRVAAEYEGPHHRTPEQIARDIRRAETMRRIGWIEVRIVVGDMRCGARSAVRRVVAALREHGWDGRT